MKEEAVKKITEARDVKDFTQTEVAAMLAARLKQSYSLRQYQKLEAGIFPKYKREIVITLGEILEIKELFSLVYGNALDDSSINKSYSNKEETDDEPDGVVYVSAIAQARYSTRSHELRYINDLPRIDLHDADYQGDEYRIFEVNGQSMQPYYEHGDFLVCKKADLHPNLSPEEEFQSYLVVRQNEVLLGWLTSKDNENYAIKNSQSAPVALPINSIKEIWIVKKVMQWKDPIRKVYSTQ